MAEVCCGLATWSWVGKGAGISTGPVIDSDEWCCAQCEQLGQEAFCLSLEDPDAWETLYTARPWAVVGSPPCPPFSQAGARKGWADCRSQVTLWCAVSAILSGARVFVLEQVPEFAASWSPLWLLCRAAGWIIQAAPVSSHPFAAAQRNRLVVFGAPDSDAGSEWLCQVTRALASLRQGVAPNAVAEGSVVLEWMGPETAIPFHWQPGLKDVRRIGPTGHFPCPTAAGTSLDMLARHAAGWSKCYGLLVEGPEGPRRLSLWETGASMGSVPLPWPVKEAGRWLSALGNAIPTAIPGQALQAMQAVGGHHGRALQYASQQRERQRRSLPTKVDSS